MAIALAPRPKLLIADEPTSALDVTVQSQILNLLKSLTKLSNTTVLLITHDLGVIAQTAQRVGVMHNGQIVEQLTVDQLFSAPRHPFTQGLLQALLLHKSD